MGVNMSEESEKVVKDVKLYVGCSLSHASEVFKESVETLKKDLRDKGYEVFDFVGLVNGTAKEVYEWDIQHCVGECDAFVAICDEPSIGLGWELAVAQQLNKPILALAHTEAKVTRMLLGAAEVEPNLRFERYEQLSDTIPLISEMLAAHPGKGSDVIAKKGPLARSNR
jgi:nucleoside 2-deoxyribosyltransferase